MEIRQNDQQSKFAYICHNETCVGFLLARGHVGFEAFDQNERSLGMFATELAAVTAVFNATGAP